jgi:hypothetical protein
MGKQHYPGESGLIEVFISSREMHERVKAVHELGSPDFFAQSLAAAVIREAWGYEAMRLAARVEFKELFERGNPLFWKEILEFIPDLRIVWPSEGFSKYLVPHDAELTRFGAIAIAVEFFEAKKTFEYLSWAVRSRRFYFPERIPQAFTKPLSAGSKEKAEIMQYEIQQVALTNGGEAALLESSLRFTVHGLLARFIRAKRDQGERTDDLTSAMGFFAFSEFERFVKTKGQEGLDVRLLDPVLKDMFLPAWLFGSSAARLLPEVRKISARWEATRQRSELRHVSLRGAEGDKAISEPRLLRPPLKQWRVRNDGNSAELRNFESPMTDITLMRSSVFEAAKQRGTSRTELPSPFLLND